MAPTCALCTTALEDGARPADALGVILCPGCKAGMEARREGLRREIARLRQLRETARRHSQRSRQIERLLVQTVERTRGLLLARRARTRPATILVVEDEPAVRDSIRLFLEDCGGARVIVAQDGRAGLTAARIEKPDLILTDLRMPRMDGWELVRRVREEPDLAGTPVVAVSAFASGDEHRLSAAGFDAWLGKPFDPTDLVAVLERARRRIEAA